MSEPSKFECMNAAARLVEHLDEAIAFYHLNANPRPYDYSEEQQMLDTLNACGVKEDIKRGLKRIEDAAIRGDKIIGLSHYETAAREAANLKQFFFQELEKK